jgi:3,4-dihydroxy 2-butanone 4-phosphate synthase/GTP cyclohydrolase II
MDDALPYDDASQYFDTLIRPDHGTPGYERTSDYGQTGWFTTWPGRAEEFFRHCRRPLVTVSYAQSVDGSIASRAREQLLLSGSQAMVLTHRIRAACDAIVIGINTVLADNPQLTVRLADGVSPQPVVLDTNLRIPLETRLLARTDRRSWVACADDTENERIVALGQRGAEVLPCSRDRYGRVDLPSLLDLLGKRGIRSLMVEGGAQVISSFLEARLVDQLIITIAPRLVGGLSVLDRPTAGNGANLHLREVRYEPCGPDLILWARPHWNTA